MREYLNRSDQAQNIICDIIFSLVKININRCNNPYTNPQAWQCRLLMSYTA